MAPKTFLRDNPPSASSSSSEESGSSTEDSGSSEYETTEDDAVKPNGKSGSSSTLIRSPNKRQPGASGSKSEYDLGDDSAEPNGKPDDSSGKAPSLETKQTKTPVSSTEFDSESTDDETAKPSRKLSGSSSKRPPSPAPTKKQQPEEESGSDSETQSSEGKAVRKRDQKPGSSSSKPSQQQKPRLTSGKREAEKTPDPKSSKRAKTVVDEKKLAFMSSQDLEKKNPFQRVFSDSDEIEILKATAEYEAKKKGNVVHDANDYYEFIKMRIETKFTKSQLLKKLNSMKRRFPGLENRVNKGLKTLKPLDPIIYELSNKLWGSGGLLEKTEKELVVENTTPSVKVRKLFPSSSKLTNKPSMDVINNNHNGVVSWYLSENLGVCHKGGVDPEYMKEVMDSVDECERTELEIRWKKNQADMAKVLEERSMIAQQVCKLVYKHSSSFTTPTAPS